MAKDNNIKLKRKNALSGENNPMYGKSYYDIWVEKYGKEIAAEKEKEKSHKTSINTTGKKNHMYGKPSPKKSGNGWSGYYKNHYFRSILELKYLVYLLDNDIKFESGEKQQYKIEYEIDGKKRNYFPDFYLIDTQEIIEIKPKSLINSKMNKAKIEAGYNKHGNKFIIKTNEDIIDVNLDKLWNMYQNKEIIWDKNYDTKFDIYYKKEKQL